MIHLTSYRRRRLSTDDFHLSTSPIGFPVFHLHRHRTGTSDNRNRQPTVDQRRASARPFRSIILFGSNFTALDYRPHDDGPTHRTPRASERFSINPRATLHLFVASGSPSPLRLVLFSRTIRFESTALDRSTFPSHRRSRRDRRFIPLKHSTTQLDIFIVNALMPIFIDFFKRHFFCQQ